MKHAVILAILYFLVGNGRCQQCSLYHEMNLISRLNRAYGFDHNVYFLDAITNHNRLNLSMQSNDGNFISQTVYIFNHVLVGSNGTQLSTLRSLGGKRTFVVIMIANVEIDQLISQVGVIQKRLGANVHIGVFFVSEVLSTDLVERIFRSSWSTGIVNIFCAFHTNTSDFNVFGYNPFVTFDLINLTESQSPNNYFPSGVPNYHGHPLRCAMADFLGVSDVANIFWEIVVCVFNASRLNVPYSYSTSYENIDADILVHERSFDGTQWPCYPHRMLTLVLMAPHAKPYSDFVAYLRNGTWTLIFVYTFIAIAAASLLLIISEYMQSKKISIFKCVTDIINLLINDNGAIKYGQLKRAEVCIIVPFTFAGLIAVNGIFSVFQSYLSVPIYERQINTIEDIFKSPIQVKVEYSWKDDVILMLEDLSHHGEWDNKVRSTSDVHLFEEVQRYNPSAAFIGFSNEVRLYLETQKRLGIKAYHMVAEPYLEKTNVGFMVFRNYPFIEPINDLVRRLLSAGLIQKWIMDQDHVTLNNLLRQGVHLQVQRSVESQLICGIPNVVLYGWIASVMSFICEIAWNRLKLQIKRIFPIAKE